MWPDRAEAFFAMVGQATSLLDWMAATLIVLGLIWAGIELHFRFFSRKRRG